METETVSFETKMLEYELRKMTQEGWHQFLVTIDGNFAEVVAVRLTTISPQEEP